MFITGGGSPGETPVPQAPVSEATPPPDGVVTEDLVQQAARAAASVVPGVYIAGSGKGFSSFGEAKDHMDATRGEGGQVPTAPITLPKDVPAAPGALGPARTEAADDLSRQRERYGWGDSQPGPDAWREGPEE